MGMFFNEYYKDPQTAQQIVSQIKRIHRKPIRVMEVCGTHTMSLFKHGIPYLLPDAITLLSGPGCPVCVTSQGEIDGFLALSQKKEVIITTFGDLIRVPGSRSSLQDEKSEGSDIRMVYSSFDALKIAEDHPQKEVVFLGVGFETTAPTVAAAILKAAEKKVSNFSVFCANKRVPPALMALMSRENSGIDGFILPGHVSTVIGKNAYISFFNQYRLPSVIAGFEPVDLLTAILELVDQIESEKPQLVNGYPRAVTSEGNIKAQKILSQVFDVSSVSWRGLGSIEDSGFRIKEIFQNFDAQKRFELEVSAVEDPKGCRCGDVLTGRITPEGCPMYKTQCTPLSPVGPCMVSTEGTCAAYFRYKG